jgi:hypothetical protein
MSQLTLGNRSQLFAAATAISAAVLLTVSPPAQAHPILPLAPACTQYGFNGPFTLQQTSGDTVTFNATGPNASGVMADANSGEYHGPVTGGITGAKLDFTISWRGRGVPDNGSLYSKGRYTGTVGNDGFAHGDTHDELSPASALWDSTVPLVCLTQAADPAPPPPPAVTTVVPFPGAKVPPPYVDQPSAPPAPPKPLQGPTVSANPGLTGVTFHVTDRSGVASQCTYSSEGYTNGFALPANGSFDLFVPAIREFRTRTGTISCDNGTSTNTSVFF